MKNFRQLVKELPSSTVVVTTGSFNPPTAKHELQFKLVEKLVEKHNAQHVIYIKEEGLPTDRKTHFLSLMFKPFNYVPLKGTLNEEVTKLKAKYKNVIVVGDTVKGKLAESVQSIPFDDAETSKIKSMVTKGDYYSFKKLMPASTRDIDAKRMFNEMRQVYGLEFLKEDVKFSIDALRDKYFRGEIYHIGDIVESAGEQYEIMDRGSNYLVVVNNTGDLSRKWVKDVSLVEAKKLDKACWKGYKAIGLKNKNGRQVPNCVPESVLNPNDPHGDYQAKKKVLLDLGKNKDVDQSHVQQRNLDLDKEYKKLNEQHDDKQISYKGYTTSNFHHVPELVKAFKLAAADAKDPVAMLNAVKTTDAYLDIHNLTGNNPTIDQVKNWKYAHIKAKEALQKIGVFDKNQVQYEEAGFKINTLAEAIDIGKYSTQNIAQSAKSYQAIMKWARASLPQAVDNKEIKQVIEPNISQTEDDLQDWPFHPQTSVGHTLATRPHLRRQKAIYATESMITGDLMDEDFATKFTTEANSGEVGDEIGNDKIAKVKTLPPQLAPKKKVAERLGGGTRDHTFSAFMEKQKKENVDFDFDQMTKRRLAKE